METDTGFFEIFESNPDRLTELTALDLPKFRSANSQALKKTVQIQCDLLFEPEVPSDPKWILEIQLYFDHSIFNRIDMARAMVWKNRNRRKDCLIKGYEPGEVRGIVIFGDRTMLPANTGRHSDIEYLFLDELVENLKKNSPQSPLIDVLAPLFESDEELEKRAAEHYGSINKSAGLSSDERKTLGEVFIHFFSQRFKNLTYQQIRNMIAELTPIEKTQVGKDLIEKGIVKGIEKGARNERQKLAQNLRETGMQIEDIAKVMKLEIEAIKDLLE